MRIQRETLKIQRMGSIAFGIEMPTVKAVGGASVKPVLNRSREAVGAGEAAIAALPVPPRHPCPPGPPSSVAGQVLEPVLEV